MGNLNFPPTPKTYDSVLSYGLRFRTCLKLTATRLSRDFLRACVRTSRVTIARVSLHSCYIARLIRTSVCRADTGWMTKSRTVDPESRFSLSTTRACCTRTWSVAAPAPISLPRLHKNHFPSLDFVLPPFCENPPSFSRNVLRNMIILKKKNTQCVSSYKLYYILHEWKREIIVFIW